MRLGIFDPGTPDQATDTIRDALRYTGAETVGPGSVPDNMDCILVPGGDRGVRRYFRQVDAPSVPVMGVSEGEAGGFLAQVDIKEISWYVSRLQRSDYSIEEIPRLGVRADRKGVYPVLNDASVFSSKSAMLMEHTLRVNGQEVWHDNSDGVIVSTPMGSTAYSMSAGGPMIFQGSPVLGIVSVNSLDVTRRPLVVPGDSLVEMDEISAKTHCEVILDGTDRMAVKRSVTCSVFGPPAKIVRMQNDATSIAVLAKKVHLAEDLLSMPPSAKLLLKTLEYEGTMTPREMAAKTLLPDRTVRMALTHLLKKGYVKKKVSVRDARQKIYEISGIR